MLQKYNVSCLAVFQT